MLIVLKRVDGHNFSGPGMILGTGATSPTSAQGSVLPKQFWLHNTNEQIQSDSHNTTKRVAQAHELSKPCSNQRIVHDANPG